MMRLGVRQQRNAAAPAPRSVIPEPAALDPPKSKPRPVTSPPPSPAPTGARAAAEAIINAGRRQRGEAAITLDASSPPESSALTEPFVTAPRNAMTLSQPIEIANVIVARQFCNRHTLRTGKPLL
jgi:hypothetical protein